jgi:hypothetical protein
MFALKRGKNPLPRLKIKKLLGQFGFLLRRKDPKSAMIAWGQKEFFSSSWSFWLL